MSEEREKDTYNSISALSKGLYKDKGSKFLSFAIPVSCEDDIRKEIDALKKEYYDARHHCYAYRLGKDGEIWRANDDGEPSSSAGRPILGQLMSYELSDILVVVVRYFGGIKLGVPGLIKAYKSATADAIENGVIIEKRACRRLRITFDYMEINRAMKALKDYSLTPESQNFDNMCSIEVNVRLSCVDTFSQTISSFAQIETLI
ncbi:MAG: IMPACT family protein [Candidatus Coprenecus sp.]|nr:YigZ family protein [Candidatus Coprenecus sp.]